MSQDGYCEHGVYVGGCGIDYMCGYCEQGIPAKDVAAIQNEQLRLREESHVNMIAEILKSQTINEECQTALIQLTESNFNHELAKRVKALFQG